MKTRIADDNALIPKVISKRLYRELMLRSFFGKFMGKGMNNIVQVKTDLTKKKGDTITFGLVKKLSGNGVKDYQTLEGREERLYDASSEVDIHLYRHAVITESELDEQKISYDLYKEMKEALMMWGEEKIEKLCFDALYTSPNIVMSGDTGHNDSGVFGIESSLAAGIAGVTAGNRMTSDFLSKIRTFAETGGGRRYQPIRPIKVNGKPYYVMLVHPDVLYDMRKDSSIVAAHKDAMERGINNPLFQHANVIWDGVLVYSNEQCLIGKNASTYAYARSALLGAQALTWAWAKRPKLVKDERDFGDEVALCWKILAGVKRTQFESKDWASINVVTGRTPISDVV